MNSMFGAAGFGNQVKSNQGPTTAGGINNSTGYYKEKVPKGYKAGKLQQFTPEQIELFQSLFGHLGPDSFLARLAGGDEEMFQQLEAPAMKQFAGLQGDIASRFSGMGSTGARRSSGFQNFSNQAAQDFASQLQSQRMGLQSQAQKDLFELSNLLMGQRPYERTLTEKPPSFFDRWLGLAANTMGAAARAPVAGA